MTLRLASHATIAILVSSCALDFSWPLDLVASCETDDHCPEGLVCRFNSCGRDAVGKDGEPCNADGRCEQGLLCDAIVCRQSRNNEPVPVWDFALGNGFGMNMLGLQVGEDGGAFATVSVSQDVSLDGVPVPRIGEGSGLSVLALRFADDGAVSEAGLFAASPFSSLAAQLEALVLHAGPEYALVAEEHLDLDSVSVSLRTTVILRTLRLGLREASETIRLARSGGDVALVDAAPDPVAPWLAIKVTPDDPDPVDDPRLAAVLLLDALGGTTESWVFTDTEVDSSLSSLSELASAGDGTAFVTRLRSVEEIGLAGDPDAPALEVLRLRPGEIATRVLSITGGGVGFGNVAAGPDGRFAHCFVGASLPAAWDPAGRRTHPVASRLDDSDVMVVRADPAGALAVRVLSIDGLQGLPDCAFVRDGTLVIATSTSGREPPRPGRLATDVDLDLLFIGLDERTLETKWMLRYGDAGAQRSDWVASTPDGFLVAGAFSATLNFGQGTRRARSGNDLFLARFTLPPP